MENILAGLVQEEKTLAAREQDVMACSLPADDAGELENDAFPFRDELRFWAQDEKARGVVPGQRFTCKESESNRGEAGLWHDTDWCSLSYTTSLTCADTVLR